MNNEEIINEYIEMTKNSWTYERLTQEERKRLINLFYHPSIVNSLKYTKEHKWDVLHDVYYSYLVALGYTPIGWREEYE